MKIIKIFTWAFVLLSTQTWAQSNARNLELLSYTSSKPNVVIDTDAYNEVDDQFALVYAILSQSQINIEAIYAAPFINKRAKSVQEGMEKSYDEIYNIMNRMKVKLPVYKGSSEFMKSKTQPVESEAARDLVKRAKAAKEPLVVLALGAPTNVASALVMNPEIKDKIVVVWLGGKGINWKTAREYNLFQDPVSSQILFDFGVALVQIPTEPVSSHLITTVAELQEHIGGKNNVSDYLISIVKAYTNDPFGWSKVIWDIAVIAYVIDPAWLQFELRPAPILTNELTYSNDGTRHIYKVATFINRDKVFKDMFKKFAAFKD